jgi:hypothetical protein
MPAEPGNRCTEMGMTPTAGAWDYDRTAGEVGDTISVAVFQWIASENGTDVKRDRAVKRFRGSGSELSTLYQRAEALCQELENADIANSCNTRIRINVASAANTPVEVLAALSDDKDVRVRINVAKHRNTAPWILDKLSKDSEAEVRATVARNPNSGAQIRAVLAQDRIGTVITAAKDSQKFVEGQNLGILP